MLTPLVWLSSLSFLSFGILCLTTPYMAAEFDRYDLSGVRTLTGGLQILAAVGLLIGFWAPKLGALAATGLALQMLVGIGVRIRIEDSFIQGLPAAFYLVVNAFIAYLFLVRH